MSKLLKELKQKIADLEAKLAESENKIKGFVELFDKKQHENYEQFCEIMQLKQQLAEKDAEIKKLNTRILVSQLQAPEEQRLKIIGSSCCQYNPNQEKISFAVEKLEEVKHYAQHTQGGLINYIDNQIEELKKHK